VTVVRLFNTVGPRQSSRYGMVIPTFVRQALAGEPLTVHGDGSQTRSFTWVGDVVWALARLLAEPRAAGEVFNVGNGAEISVYDLARRVKEMTGSSSEIQLQPYQQAFDASFEDMPRRVPDISKIRRFIAYEPKVHLDAILQHVIDFWAPEVSRPLFSRSRVRTTQPAFLPPVATAAARLSVPSELAKATA
jgi:UDP-glucose 4-epimerase